MCSFKNQRLKSVWLLTMLFLVAFSCSKEDEEPGYQGKWLFEKAVPELDVSYSGSYIYIKFDKSFEFFDSSKNMLIIGKPEHFHLSGIKLELTDPDTKEKYFFTILSRKQDILVLRTSVFGRETEITMRKVSE